jgi:ATP-dependent Lon protease
MAMDVAPRTRPEPEPEQEPDRGSADLIAQYRQRIELAGMPSRVRREAFRHLARLSRVPPGSFDHYMVRGYLEAVIEMPWPERAAAERRLLATVFAADPGSGSDGHEVPIAT